MSRFRAGVQRACLLVLIIILAGCGGGSGSGAYQTDSARPGQASVIDLVITEPTPAATMETSDGSVVLAGTASSGPGIVRIVWSNDRGGQGTATGTDTWKTAGIELKPGKNVITVTAEDAAGATANRRIAITRESTGKKSATLSWTAPTTRVDGTPLTNLAGYKLKYGRMSGVYDYTIDIDNPGIQSYVIEGLVPGKWHFVMLAYDAEGMESEPSNEVRFTIS